LVPPVRGISMPALANFVSPRLHCHSDGSPLVTMSIA
jgi:hypothetical protein